MHSIEVVLAMLLAVVASGYLVRIIRFALPLPLVQIALGAVIAGVLGRGVRLDPEIFFVLFLLTWMVVNTAWLLREPPDPFPYIFLNLILSCIAALQAPVIMMSQNRQASKDRLQADLDYQVNLKAEFAIQQLHRKIDELRSSLAQQKHATQAGHPKGGTA